MPRTFEDGQDGHGVLLPGKIQPAIAIRSLVVAKMAKKWPPCQFVHEGGNVAMLLLVHVLNNVRVIVCCTQVTLPVWQCYSTKWQCYSLIRSHLQSPADGSFFALPVPENSRERGTSTYPSDGCFVSPREEWKRARSCNRPAPRLMDGLQTPKAGKVILGSPKAAPSRPSSSDRTHGLHRGLR
jgi:hypothetical protein